MRLKWRYNNKTVHNSATRGGQHGEGGWKHDVNIILLSFFSCCPATQGWDNMPQETPPRKAKVLLSTWTRKILSKACPMTAQSPIICCRAQWLLKAILNAYKYLYKNICMCTYVYICIYIYIYICIHVICYVLHLKIVRAKMNDNGLDETVASCMCWTMHCLSRQKRGLASKSKESVPSISNDCSKPNHIGPSAMTAQSPARSAKTSTETCIRAPTYIYIYI